MFFSLAEAAVVSQSLSPLLPDSCPTRRRLHSFNVMLSSSIVISTAAFKVICADILYLPNTVPSGDEVYHYVWCNNQMQHHGCIYNDFRPYRISTFTTYIQRYLHLLLLTTNIQQHLHQITGQHLLFLFFFTNLIKSFSGFVIVIVKVGANGSICSCHMFRLVNIEISENIQITGVEQPL